MLAQDDVACIAPPKERTICLSTKVLKMTIPTTTTINHTQRWWQRHRLRQLLLASCIIGLAVLSSTICLPTAWSDSASNTTTSHNNNTTTTSSTLQTTAMSSLERWRIIELQRTTGSSMSPQRRRETEGEEDNHDLAPTIHNDDIIISSSIVSYIDLTHLSYDSSCLSDEGHRILAAKYLQERRSVTSSSAVSMISQEQEKTEWMNSNDDHSHHRWLDDNNSSSEEIMTDDAVVVVDQLFTTDNSNSQYLRGGGGGSRFTGSSSVIEKNKRHDDNGPEEATVAGARMMMTRKTNNMMSPKKLLLRTAAAASSSSISNHQSSHHDQRNLWSDEYDSTEQQLEGWTTHTGSEIIVPPPSSSNTNNNNNNNNEDAQLLQQHIMDYVNSQTTSGGWDNDNNIIPNTNAAAEKLNEEQQDEENDKEKEEEELYQRLQEVMKVTQSLHQQFGGTPFTTNDNNVNNNNTMTQYSHTSTHSRQRLITGSYATWQWYDRSNLASPINLKLEKVSRINYAFFQSDTDGYIFGTDSWADPNVLNGPYDFSVSRDKLPTYCQGGKGRDDGKNKSEKEGSGGSSSSGSATGKRTRRRTQLSNDVQPCEYFERCHRNFPNSKVCNVHKYKEGLIYLAHKSGAEIYPSIGGWTLSGSFPTVAADAEKRRRFAKECVGLIEDYGFDGIDIGMLYIYMQYYIDPFLSDIVIIIT